MTQGRDAALDHLSSKVSDHSTVLQAIQVDMRHMVKAMDKLVGVSEQQAVLGNELQRLSQSIDRAFQDMRAQRSELSEAMAGHKSDFSTSIEALGRDLRAFGETVTGHKSGVTVLRWVVGITLPLGLALIGMVYAQLQADIADARGDSAASYSILETTLNRERARIETQHDRDVKDLDARLDALEAR